MELKEEAAVAADDLVQDEQATVETDGRAYMIDGPFGSCVVVGKQYIQGVIITMAHVDGRDESEYVSTPVDQVRVTPMPKSIYYMHRDQNTTLQ